MEYLLQEYCQRISRCNQGESSHAGRSYAQAQSSKLKAQSSKLKAQSSKLKAQKLNHLISNPSIKGFSLLELIVTLSVVGIISSMAVPNFVTMVQNNRIKTTTNTIVSTLQFARQTAAIHRKTVTVCTPLSGDTTNCAFTYNWNNGVAVVEGKAKIKPATIPAPPQPPIEPTLELVPLPKAQHPEQQPKLAKNLHTEDGGGIRSRSHQTGSWTYDKECNYNGHYRGDYLHIISISYIDANGKQVKFSKNLSDVICSQGDDIVKTFRPNQQQYQQSYQAAKKEYDKLLAQFHETNEKATNDYNKQLADYQKALADIDEANKINKARQAAYKNEYEHYKSQLPKYEADKKKYDEELASTPSMAVTLDKPNKLLANNPFAVTVSHNFKNGALIYKHDNPVGISSNERIDITDRRGKGEHSRAICVNILGAINVIKGNQKCPFLKNNA